MPVIIIIVYYATRAAYTLANMHIYTSINILKS